MAVVEQTKTEVSPEPQPQPLRAGQWSWSLFGLVTAATVVLFFYGINRWPWDHDEVPTLLEMGLLDMELRHDFGGQLERMPRLAPVWYAFQRPALLVLPMNEWGTRVVSATFGALTVLLAFIFAARQRGLLFAAALALVLDGSQFFIWVSQQNRFYPAALFFLLLTWAAVWSWRGGVGMVILSAVLAALAVLSHNLLVVVFCLGFAAACAAWWLGAVSVGVVWRTAATALVSILIYFLYLRSLMQGWISGSTGGTNVLVSFAAQAGVPTLALALVGAAAGLAGQGKDLLWWLLLAAGGLLFLAASPLLLPNWNPRYGVLFMTPLWFLAAAGIESVARRLPTTTWRLAWFTAAALLFLPKLASHYVDGSRHDFRGAAEVLVRAGYRDQKVYCNWPETLQYYLRVTHNDPVYGWDKGTDLPQAECYLVYSSNAWDPVLQFPGRKTEVLGELVKRRFDEQSHLVRVYRLGYRDRPPPVLDDTLKELK